MCLLWLRCVFLLPCSPSIHCSTLLQRGTSALLVLCALGLADILPLLDIDDDAIVEGDKVRHAQPDAVREHALPAIVRLALLSPPRQLGNMVCSLRPKNG